MNKNSHFSILRYIEESFKIWKFTLKWLFEENYYILGLIGDLTNCKVHRKGTTKRTRVRLYRTVAPCMQPGRLAISSAHFMNAGKCAHAQNPYFFQTFGDESSTIGGREEK